MIKGPGYLKYLKLSLIGFGISCFTVFVGSSVNAGYSDIVVVQNGSYVSDGVDPNTQFFVTSRGMLSSQSLGTVRRMLAFSSKDLTRIYFWWYNGLPYIYYYYYADAVNIQGQPTVYQICDQLSLGDTTVNNCTNESITDSFVENVKPFFNSIKSTDLFGYHFGWYTLNGRKYYIRTCFSSAQYGKSICFMSTDGLANSLGLSANIGFGDIPQAYLGDPPGWSTSSGSGGSSIEGGSYTGNFNTSTGNVVTSSCSKRNALDWYRCNGYKTRMCYSSYGNVSDLYTGPGSSSSYDLTGVDIEDVWFDSAWYRRNGLTGDSMGYSDWFSYWRKTYNVYKQNPQHTNPFLGVPVAIFTLMGNVNSYGLPYSDASILEFCDLSLYTSDYSKSYTGVAQSAVCSMSALDIIDCQTANQLNPDNGLPGDGTNVGGTVGPVGSSWDGITNRTGYHDKPGVSTTGQVATGNDLNTFDDGATFLNNFFNKLSDNFQYGDNNGSTRIPSYIIVFLCAVILFKFLRK